MSSSGQKNRPSSIYKCFSYQTAIRHIFHPTKLRENGCLCCSQMKCTFPHNSLCTQSQGYLCYPALQNWPVDVSQHTPENTACPFRSPLVSSNKQLMTQPFWLLPAYVGKIFFMEKVGALHTTIVFLKPLQVFTAGTSLFGLCIQVGWGKTFQLQASISLFKITSKVSSSFNLNLNPRLIRHLT